MDGFYIVIACQNFVEINFHAVREFWTVSYTQNKSVIFGLTIIFLFLFPDNLSNQTHFIIIFGEFFYDFF